MAQRPRAKVLAKAEKRMVTSVGGLSLPVPLFAAGVFPVDFGPQYEDFSPQRGPFVSRVDTSPGQLLEEPWTAERFDKVYQAALTNQQVRRHLRNKRYSVDSVGRVPAQQTDKSRSSSVPTHGRVIIYNYTDNVAISVRVDLPDYQVPSVSRGHYQPPLSAKELDHAIELALKDNRVSKWLTSNLAPRGILLSTEQNKKAAQDRRVLVLFGRVDARSPLYWCIVNLSDDVVREVGSAPTIQRQR